MSTYLAFVQHDTKQNTLEATWLQEVLDAQGVVREYIEFRCQNYSQPQKAQFLSDLSTVGTLPTDGTKYVTMAGW